MASGDPVTINKRQIAAPRAGLDAAPNDRARYNRLAKALAAAGEWPALQALVFAGQPYAAERCIAAVPIGTSRGLAIVTRGDAVEVLSFRLIEGGAAIRYHAALDPQRTRPARLSAAHFLGASNPSLSLSVTAKTV